MRIYYVVGFLHVGIPTCTVARDGFFLHVPVLVRVHVGWPMYSTCHAEEQDQALSKIRRWGDPEKSKDSSTKIDEIHPRGKRSCLTATQPPRHKPSTRESLDHALRLRERFQPSGQAKRRSNHRPAFPDEQDGISSPARASLSAPDCRRASSSTPSQQVLPLQLLSPRPSTHRNSISIVQRHGCLAKQCQEATYDQRGRQYQQATSSPQDSSASLPGLPPFDSWNRQKYHDIWFRPEGAITHPQ